MKTIIIASVLGLASAAATVPNVQANEGDLAALLHVMVKQETTVFTHQLRAGFKDIVAAQLEQNRADLTQWAQSEQEMRDEVVNKQVEKSADELAP